MHQHHDHALWIRSITGQKLCELERENNALKTERSGLKVDIEAFKEVVQQEEMVRYQIVENGPELSLTFGIS